MTPSLLGLSVLLAVEVINTELDLDLQSGAGVAQLEVDEPGWVQLRLRAAGIQATAEGRRRPMRQDGEMLAVRVGSSRRVTIRYQLQLPEATSWSSLSWPDTCGDWFPCQPEVGRASRFTVRVRPPENRRSPLEAYAVESPVPAYAIGLAVGDYRHAELGTTASGTRVQIWWLPETEARLRRGTRHLVALQDWLERSLGPLPYGSVAGSIAVDWAEDGYAAVEHAPLAHVDVDSLERELTHAHEAAHAWFGNGVRIACWEDLVLSEGLATYLSVRAVEAVHGAKRGVEEWARLEGERANRLVARDLWSEGCTVSDGRRVIERAVYVRGALAMRAIEERVGRPALDEVLRIFVADKRGQAARFRELLDAVAAATGHDVVPIAQSWLMSGGDEGAL